MPSQLYEHIDQRGGHRLNDPDGLARRDVAEMPSSTDTPRINKHEHAKVRWAEKEESHSV